MEKKQQRKHHLMQVHHKKVEKTLWPLEIANITNTWQLKQSYPLLRLYQQYDIPTDILINTAKWHFEYVCEVTTFALEQARKSCYITCINVFKGYFYNF